MRAEVEVQRQEMEKKDAEIAQLLKELNRYKESLQQHEAKEGELREELDHKDDEIA